MDGNHVSPAVALNEQQEYEGGKIGLTRMKNKMRNKWNRPRHSMYEDSGPLAPDSSVQQIRSVLLSSSWTLS